MRILIANKFHYPRGGDCIYSLELSRLLKAQGHEVAFFAMAYPENEPSDWQDYFPSEVSFSPRKPLQLLKGLVRPLYSPEVQRKFRRLLRDFHPEVVHLNNIHTQLSPVIARIAKESGIRVVWTLHDYKLLCPRYDCLRDGKPCTLCHRGNPSFALRHSCLKGSRLASAIAFLEARKWNREKLEQWTDAFICPSRFMRDQMAAGGFDAAKLHVLHNFIDTDKLTGEPPAPQNHYCYAGRLSEEKGVRTLLQVASQLPHHLKVAGTGPLEGELKARYAEFPQIEFMGQQNWASLRGLLGSARFMVIPSEWHENNPLSLIEALALGTPVLGARIGGIPELITPGKTGRLFEPGNREELREQVMAMWADPPPPFDAAAWVLPYSSQYYLERLLPLYERNASRIEVAPDQISLAPAEEGEKNQMK